MRFWLFVALIFSFAGAARAASGSAEGGTSQTQDGTESAKNGTSQTRDAADDAGADWASFEQNAAALETVSPADCATACKALESLTRAAEHICAVAPEHCQEARARVAAAREKVRAACPACVAQFTGDEMTGRVVATESAPARGGCAGCATSGGGGRGALFALAMLLLLARVRRR